ncbi:TCR/Tet family MFS transporter [bacterium]|nr:TCR/Tet family MFS transporter [bacterium]
MSQKATTKSVQFIFITAVLDMMGIGLIIPVLPDVIRRFVSSQELVNNYFGYFVAIYALMQFFASPVLGSLSDRYGRRPVLLCSLLGAALDYLFMAFAGTLPLLFIGRIISGLTGASLTVVNSYMADVSDDTNRSANFGLVGAAFGIGFVAGPLLGGVMGHINPVAPFIAAAVLNLLNFIFGYFILPESLPVEHRRKIEIKKLNPFSSLNKLFSQKHLIIFLVTYALMFLAGQVHPSIWTLYTEYKFSWTSWQVGLSLSFVGIVYGASQALLTKKLVPIWGEYKSLKVGLFFSAFGFLLYASAPQGWMMYAIILGTCLSAMANPCLQSIMTKQVAADRQGELQGGLVSITSITSIIAPLLYSKSFDWVVSGHSSFSFVGLPYLIAAVIVFVSWILLMKKLDMNA